jgi:hypothetical protein
MDVGASLSTRIAAGIMAAFVLMSVAGCDVATDAATRIAYDIKAGAGRLGSEDGAVHSVHHKTPSASGQCTGPYKLQLDKVGAIIIWCKDASGQTVSSHSTTYHARYVDTPTTYLLDKDAGTTLTIDLERRGGRAVVTDAR